MGDQEELARIRQSARQSRLLLVACLGGTPSPERMREAARRRNPYDGRTVWGRLWRRAFLEEEEAGRG